MSGFAERMSNLPPGVTDGDIERHACANFDADPRARELIRDLAPTLRSSDRAHYDVQIPATRVLAQ